MVGDGDGEVLLLWFWGIVTTLALLGIVFVLTLPRKGK